MVGRGGSNSRPLHCIGRLAAIGRSLAAFDVVGRLLHQRIGRDGAAVGRFDRARAAGAARSPANPASKWTDPEGAPRGGTPDAAPKITLANVPPTLGFAAHEQSDSLQRQPVDDSGLSADGKMSERDVKDAIDKRMQRIRHDATRASTNEHSRS
jgi:hypothetical protein